MSNPAPSQTKDIFPSVDNGRNDSAAAKPQALIVGATGQVGQHCLQALLDSEAYKQIFALGRRPLPATLFQDPSQSLVEQQVNFAELSRLCLDSPVRDIFCCLGTTHKQAGSHAAFRQVDYDYVLALAEQGLKGWGAQRLFVVSSMGASTSSWSAYSRVKGEMEASLSQLPYQQISVFRPSLLLAQRPQRRPAEYWAGWLMRALGPLMLGPLRHWQAIPARLVGMAMVHYALGFKQTKAFRILRCADILDITKGVNPENQ